MSSQESLQGTFAGVFARLQRSLQEGFAGYCIHVRVYGEGCTV